LESDSFERALDAYTCIFRENCRSKRNSEGALLYAKELNSGISPIYNCYYSTSGHCLFLTFQINDVKAIMSYKSPGYNPNLYIERVEALLSSHSGNILFFGDINIDMQKKDGEKIRKRLMDLHFTCLIDVLSCSTDGGTHIDVCFANFQLVEAWFHESYFSYHKPICIIWPKS